MNQQTQTDPPKIRKLAEVGEAHFQFMGIAESILQGFSKLKRKTVYLFKNQEGKWSYYDKSTEQVIPVDQWQVKAAWVGGEWIKMTKYHRMNVFFLQPVTYSVWLDRRAVTQQTQEAQLLITDTAYQSLVEASKGRPTNSAYKLTFTSRKKKGGGTMNYVDKIVWAEELPNLAS